VIRPGGAFVTRQRLKAAARIAEQQTKAKGRASAGRPLRLTRSRAAPAGRATPARMAGTERTTFVPRSSSAPKALLPVWHIACNGPGMETPRPMLISWVAALSLVGCVAQGKYDAAVADATRARADLQAHQQLTEKDRNDQKAQIAQLQREIAEAKEALASTQQELEFAGGIAVSCGEALDEQSTLVEGLQAELERLGKDVDKLSATKAELTGSLERARAGLEELRGAQADAEARAALFRDVAQRLQSMLDAGELRIILRSGRMVLVLPSDILFDAGKAKLGGKGRTVLAEIGGVLASAPGRRFQVSGHTDSDPIRVSGFASNWDLSSARALEVVNVLVQAGMKPAALSVAGYAEFDPVAANDTASNKAKNRRIEIALQPNIDELIQLPDPASTAKSGSTTPEPRATATATPK
jgi:chemotaxis protein MotB